MHVIETHETIDASPEQVWEVISDLEGFEKWNPVIVSVEGRAVVGENIAFRMVLPGGGKSRHEPKIIEATPHQALRWEGTVGAAFLARAVHEFLLRPVEGGTSLTQKETFTGLLVPLVKGTLKRTEEGFNEMNRALKVHVEDRVARKN